MVKNQFIRSLFPYFVPVIIILLSSIIYFMPQFEGKVVRQGDIVSYDGAAREANDYRKRKQVKKRSGQILCFQECPPQ
jgi:hypothetical protein